MLIRWNKLNQKLNHLSATTCLAFLVLQVLSQPEQVHNVAFWNLVIFIGEKAVPHIAHCHHHRCLFFPLPLLTVVHRRGREAFWTRWRKLPLWSDQASCCWPPSETHSHGRISIQVQPINEPERRTENVHHSSTVDPIQRYKQELLETSTGIFRGSGELQETSGRTCGISCTWPWKATTKLSSTWVKWCFHYLFFFFIFSVLLLCCQHEALLDSLSMNDFMLSSFHSAWLQPLGVDQ